MWTALTAACLLAQTVSEDLPPEIAKWEKDIAAFEQLDRTEATPQNAILFYGSSSVRRWDTIVEDMAPWPVIQRGYGGARFSDGSHYAKRVIEPHAKRTRAIVIFFANDISGNKSNDVTPEVVTERVSTMLANIRKVYPARPIILTEVTPTESRWDVWREIVQASELIRGLVDNDPNTHFLPTAGAFLNAQGLPRAELFVGDKLHLNEDGYDLWAALIKAKLHDVVGPAIPDSITRWESDIQRFEASDGESPEDALLVYGSSSIRLWKTIENDLAPSPVIARGYGGASLSDAAYYAERVIKPHDPKAILLFIGNDIYNGGRTPAQGLQDFKKLLSEIRRLKGNIPVVWINVRPVLAKFDLWPKVEDLNRRIAKHCQKDPNAHVLSFEQKFLTDEGSPHEDLFADDDVHLNEAGYKIWSDEIRRGLPQLLSKDAPTSKN